MMTTPHPPRMSIEEVIKENMTIGETLTDGLTNFTQIATNTAAKLHNRVISGSPLSNLPVSTQTKRKKEISKEATVPREMKEIKRDATSDNDEVFTFSPYPGDNSPPLVYVYPYKGDRVVLVYMDGGIFKTSWRIPTFPGMHPGRPKFILQAIEKPTQFLPFLFSHRIDTNRLHANFAVLGDSILSGGHWDDFLLCGNVVSGAVISQIGEHKDVVSCMGISDDGTILATGSLDCTCLIWETSSFDQKTLTRDELPKPKLILYGQDRPINCVDVSTDLDLVITGSSDGVCILYELSKGSFLRTLKHQDPVHLVKLSTQGVIVTYCESINFNEIYLHSINGNRLAQFPTTTTIYCMLVTEDGDYLVSGGESGCVIVQSLYSLNLKIVQEWKCKSKILSLALTEQKVQRPRFLMVGLDTGEFRVIRFDPATFRPV
uniref:Neurobeachin beta-propeller domain-containing protein n=1 Tax=Arcella intermedia TaxID=1963864 RepID=A0A6B2L2B5_9EUKA